MVTVTILRQANPGRDALGDLSDDTPAEIEVTNCQLAPATGDVTDVAGAELHRHARDGAVISLTLYRQPPVEFLHTDRVQVGEHIFDVEGYPAVWANEGVVVKLRRTVG